MAPAPPARDLVVVQTERISSVVSSAVPDPGALPDARPWIGRVGAPPTARPQGRGHTLLERAFSLVRGCMSGNLRKERFMLTTPTPPSRAPSSPPTRPPLSW